MENSKPVRIIGVGNVLCMDDGLGPFAIAALEAEYEFPEGVEVLDVGTPGLDFTPYLSDARMVMVLDTVRGEESPGTLRLIRDQEIVAKPPPSRMSPHEPGLREALLATELSECSPEEILLIGVVPESTEQGTRLTDAVRESVPEVVKTVVDELNRLGLTPSRRVPPGEPDTWWEK
ncbi:MAG: HyaD/HybD family hydrogenase maturation endopeptidase [Holophagae bacterium]|jgi:hydrogenase maturation protease